ncbi:MAG: hypothetical protein P8Z30_14690 [Acidobacteriota bacterium]
MSGLPRILRPGGWADRALEIAVCAAWLWKLGELIGRQSGLLRRNLGWGYVVDLTVPAALTAIAVLFFVIRRLLWRQPSVKNSR